MSKGQFVKGNHNAWTRSVANAASIVKGGNRGISQGALYYYSPMSMNPPGSLPKWDFKVLKEVFIQGVSSDHIRAFKNR